MFFEITVTGVLEMHGSKKYTEHANLVERVAFKVGVDFDKAVQRGKCCRNKFVKACTGA